MDFNNSRTIILLRVCFLTLTIFVFAYFIFHDGYFFIELTAFILFSLQVILLIKSLEKNNEDIANFLNSVRRDEMDFPDKTEFKNKDTNRLNEEFNNAFRELRVIRREKEADFQYLKNIVQHIGIGLITFDKAGDVHIFNIAARKLLKINYLENIQDLIGVSEKLLDVFMRLRTGGRELVRLELEGDIVQLSVYAIELTLRGEASKLISIQNIQNELEEKEMEAWQNLVRVLTHEIMNSVTPISSLANTVEDELNSQLQKQQDIHNIPTDDLEDIHLAIQTIKKRSKGLIRFVQDFRNLTHIPIPKVAEVKVKSMLEEVLLLLKNEIANSGIKITVQVNPPDLAVSADKELIVQVLINIIKNATQAFDEQTNKLVALNAYLDEKNRPVIAVKDNGNGIEEDALEKIFIPFFTTKQNGSGIGLSLSRQIMRQHKGALHVKSKVDEGTEFFLRF